jgi:hypothetical protein
MSLVVDLISVITVKAVGHPVGDGEHRAFGQGFAALQPVGLGDQVPVTAAAVVGAGDPLQRVAGTHRVAGLHAERLLAAADLLDPVVAGEAGDSRRQVAHLDADFIISGDRHLLDFKEYQGIRIVTAAEAVRILANIAL